MNRYFSLLVLVLALLVSCNKQETSEEGKKDSAKENMKLILFEAGTETKTHLADDGLSVLWQNND